MGKHTKHSFTLQEIFCFVSLLYLASILYSANTLHKCRLWKHWKEDNDTGVSAKRQMLWYFFTKFILKIAVQEHTKKATRVCTCSCSSPCLYNRVSCSRSPQNAYSLLLLINMSLAKSVVVSVLIYSDTLTNMLAWNKHGYTKVSVSLIPTEIRTSNQFWKYL